MAIPKKPTTLSGQKVDSFNSLLSIAMYEHRMGKKVDIAPLKRALLNVDSELFKEELKRLDEPISEQLLKEVDVATTLKVKERGRE